MADPVSAHPSEPLARVRTAVPSRHLNCKSVVLCELWFTESGTEVEVWPAGSHPTPVECETCGGSGWSGEDPESPVQCRPCAGTGEHLNLTLPTYEEVRAVIVAAWRSDCPTPEWMDLAAHNLMALFSGVPTEPEKQNDG